MIDLAIVVGDLHAGSKASVFPPEYTDGDGNTTLPNKVQRWILDQWLEFTEVFVPKLARGREFALLLMGDLIEGTHHGGKDLAAREIEFQVGVASQLLSPICKRASAVYAVEGTECHTEHNERYLCEALGAERHPEYGTCAPPEWWLKIHGCTLHMTHHITTASRHWTKAYGPNAALMMRRINSAMYGDPVPDIILRAHRHVAGDVGDERGRALIGPSWQVLTRHGHKVVPDAKPTVGAYALDWSGKRDGEQPEVRWFVRAPKASKPEVVR